MSDQLQFDEDDAKQEEALYQTTGITERRHLVRQLLQPQSGERVLSIGCGPGFEPAELAESINENGLVCGVDQSKAMVELAKRRCADYPQVALANGTATALPVADEAFEAALAVQVYEYVNDLKAALAELSRVLKPGGRAIICDADFDALVWRSMNPERMQRVLRAYDDHCVNPRLGSELAPHFRQAGFRLEQVEPTTIVNTQLSEGTFVYHFLQHLEEYAAKHAAIGPEEAARWATDVREFDSSGETFFGYTQYVHVISKPE